MSAAVSICSTLESSSFWRLLVFQQEEWQLNTPSSLSKNMGMGHKACEHCWDCLLFNWLLSSSFDLKHLSWNPVRNIIMCLLVSLFAFFKFERPVNVKKWSSQKTGMSPAGVFDTLGHLMHTRGRALKARPSGDQAGPRKLVAARDRGRTCGAC